jgi:hypothetical protein
MTSFHFILKDYGSHEGTPVKDTWRPEDGKPADLLRSAYPIAATCSTCGGRIRIESRLQYGWRHVPAGGTS